MLISPPFLPLAAPNESDEDFINRAMNSTEGAFPLGQNMVWHGGIHLTAPREGNTHLPVRAIADGTVAYVRQPTATNTDTSHPLNYRNGWTDDGCLILKHETDIGEGAHGKVVFYSIYMHLSAIKSVDIAIDMPIYRKDELGTAGRIYGAPHKIHFEVICSQEQLGHFLGRSTGRLTTTRNGRTDSCWGDVHFYIPPEILFYAARPTNPTSATNESAIVHRHIDAYFVSMNYGEGQCTLTTLDEVGTRLGERQETQDYEYNLYTTAKTLYPRSPSAGYELLRFGRILGPDLLQPHDAAHWRQVAYPTSGAHPAGVGWVNLKSPTVTVYSDADFPHWQGWKLIDDDTDGDGRCQSEQVMELLGISEIPVTPQQRTAHSAMINTPENQKKLKRLICKFPSEWERANFFNRYNWLSEGNEPIISAQAQEKLKLHYEALAFWEDMDLKDINSEHWHFPPKEFVRVFRKCGWLSSNELIRALVKAPELGRQRAEELRVPMNKMLSKYIINTSSIRISHFLAQVGIETGWWEYRQEIGGPRYFRTMYEVITPTEAGEDYDTAIARERNLPTGRRPIELPNPGPNPRPTITRENYVASRPNQIAVKAAGMDNGVANALAGGMVGDGDRFHGRGFLQITGRRNYKNYEQYRARNFTIDPNPNLLATDDYNACDASGFYWAREKINRRADEGSTQTASRVVGAIINRGNPNGIPSHNNERRQAFEAIWSVLNDEA